MRCLPAIFPAGIFGLMNEVSRFVSAGHAALDATEVLVGGRLRGLETNHAYTVPRTYLDQLAPTQRDAIASLFGDGGG